MALGAKATWERATSFTMGFSLPYFCGCPQQIGRGLMEVALTCAPMNVRTECNPRESVRGCYKAVSDYLKAC